MTFTTNHSDSEDYKMPKWRPDRFPPPLFCFPEMIQNRLFYEIDHPFVRFQCFQMKHYTIGICSRGVRPYVIKFFKYQTNMQRMYYKILTLIKREFG